MQISVSEEDLQAVEYGTLRRLGRFALDEQVERYPRKRDGRRVQESLQSLALVQAAVDQKLSRQQGQAGRVVPLATVLGATVASDTLQYRGDECPSFFENKRIDYGRAFPAPAIEALELYLHCLQSQREQHSLEALTDNFFSWLCRDAAGELGRVYSMEVDGMVFNCLGKEYKVATEKKSAGPRITLDVERYLHPGAAGQPAGKGRNGAGVGAAIGSGRISTKVSAEAAPGNNGAAKASPYQYIHGHEQVKEEFQKTATLVRHREHFTRLYNPKRLFQNYLLVGPPGTGKTSLCLELAEHCGLGFMKIPCVELLSEYHSRSSGNLHSVYESARRKVQSGNYAGMLLFFDEFDHIAKRRGYGTSPENDSLITTLNENLDGGSSMAGIITIGATNVEEMIDPAILSRFTKLYVGYPQDDAGIIGIHDAVIRQMEDYKSANYPDARLFEPLDYEKILPFARGDERYKSGRVIERVLYNASILKNLQALQSPQNQQKQYPTQNQQPPQITATVMKTTTNDVVRAYQAYRLEDDGDKPTDPPRMPRVPSLTRTRTVS